MVSSILDDYKDDIQLIRAVNHALIEKAPSEYAKNSVRGNRTILKMHGTSKVSSIYHMHLRKMVGKMGALVDIPSLPEHIQIFLKEMRQREKDYKQLLEPIVDIFEKRHGKGSAHDNKKSNNIPEFRDLNGLKFSIEEDAFNYDYKSFEAAYNEVQKFNSDCVDFIKNLRRGLDAVERFPLKTSKTSLVSIANKNIKLDYRVDKTNDLSLLQWLLSLKLAARGMLDSMNRPSPFCEFLRRNMGTQDVIMRVALNIIETHEELQQPALLDIIKQTAENIKHDIISEFSGEEIHSMLKRADYLDSSFDLMGLIPMDRNPQEKTSFKWRTRETMKALGMTCPFGHGAS